MTGSGRREIGPEELLNALRADVIEHRHHSRWAHTHGLGVLGQFTASDVAKRYCSAEHFQGDSIAVTVRLSNASSEAGRHDEWQDVRGLATKFHLAGGAEVDLIAVSVPVFIARNRSEFLAVAMANRPRRIKPERWWHRMIDALKLETPRPAQNPGQKWSGDAGLLAYAGSHPEAQMGVITAGTQAVPLSWARVKYHAIHTYVVVDPNGARRYVRFAWQPVAGVHPLEDPTSASPDFLTTEMRRRLREGPVRFELKMTIGDDGDAVDDPTKEWPVARRVVMMGALRLDRVAEDQDTQGERLSFNPMRLVPGIEPSADQILRARGEVYALAARERHAIVCPLDTATDGAP